MKKFFAVFAILQISILSYAEEIEYLESEKIVVTEKKDKERGQVIEKDEILSKSSSLADILKLSPGVILEEGSSRGETSFKIRGFSSSTVPVIVDGISTLNPYNGKGDTSNILTGDLEEVIIQKGYSNMLLGANGMGGAVLLHTSKPKSKFEGYIKTSMENNDFGFASMNNVFSFGSALEKVYFKATLQYRDIDNFVLPVGYHSMQGSIQKDRKRLFSDSSDIKTTLIAGSKAVNGLDMWIKYTYLDSDKGMNIPEVSSVYSLSGWDYYYYESISFHSKYEKDKLKANFTAYYDTYDNSMSMYSSLIHVDYNSPYKTSIYNQFAAGFNMGISYDITNKHNIKTAVTYRADSHTGFNKDSISTYKDISVEEHKLSIGAEYTYKIFPQLYFTASLGFDSLFPTKFYSMNNEFTDKLGISSYNINMKNYFLFAGQAGIFYDFIDNNQLFFTYARKNQFPTMSDRYSTQLGEVLANPNLKPEMADHVELGYKGSLFDILYIASSVYYSKISDKMVLMEVPNPVLPTSNVNYIMNLDEVSFFGFEFLSNIYILDYAELGLNLSVNGQYVNKSISKASLVTYYPLFTGNMYLKVTPFEYIEITPSITYVTSRYADIYGINKLDPYFLFDLDIAFIISEKMQINLAIKNITDELYEINRFYPLKGRTYTISLTAKF